MKAQPGFIPHVTTLGQGPRRVLALHCTMAFGGAWGGVAKAMGEGLSLVCPDMPSHGASADWDGHSDFGQTVYEATAGLLQDGPVDIVGHSFGAAIALRLAVDFPDRLRSVTLFEPVFFAVAARDAPDSLGDHNSRAEAFHAALTRGDRMAAARAFNGMWSEGADWDALSERSRAAMARAVHVVPDTMGFLFDDSAGLLAPGVLDAVAVPVLLMRGATSLPAITATVDGLVARIPGARGAVVPGAGHMAPISHPAAFAETLGPFLESIPAA